MGHKRSHWLGSTCIYLVMMILLLDITIWYSNTTRCQEFLWVDKKSKFLSMTVVKSTCRWFPFFQVERKNASSQPFCPLDFPSLQCPLSDRHAVGQKGWNVLSRATVVFTVTHHCTGPYKCHSACWEEGIKIGRQKQDHISDNVFHRLHTVTTCRFKSNPTTSYQQGCQTEIELGKSDTKTQHTLSELTLRSAHGIWRNMEVGRGRTGREVTSQASLLSRGKVPNHDGVGQPSCRQLDPG